jgi:hypothetical protein
VASVTLKKARPIIENGTKEVGSVCGAKVCLGASGAWALKLGLR